MGWRSSHTDLLGLSLQMDQETGGCNQPTWLCYGFIANLTSRTLYLASWISSLAVLKYTRAFLFYFLSYGTAKGKFSRCVSTWEFCTALFYIFGLLISHPDAISQQKPLLLWFCTECLSLARRSKQMGKLHQECLYECRNTSSVINSASELKLAQV